MHDPVGGGNEHSSSVEFDAGRDPKVLVATTVAALVLAGTAYMWRRGSGVVSLAHAALDGTTSQSDAKGKDVVADTAKPRLRRDATGKAKGPHPDARGDDADITYDGDDVDGAVGGGKQQDASGSMSKSARAKERRRRGKDPLKELMKPGGGKLAKVLKAAEVSTSSGTTVTPSTPSHSRTSSAAYQRHASISRQPEKSPSEDSSKSQQAGSSSSSTVALPASTPARSLFLHLPSTRPLSRLPVPDPSRVHVQDLAMTMAMLITSPPRRRAALPVIPTFLPRFLLHHSSTATEATSSSTSTAPSSITSSASGGSDANATPKAESGRGSSMSSSTLPTPPSPSKKRQNQDTDPWEWDGVGSASTSVTPAGPKPSSLQLPKPRATNSASSSGTEGTPVPYASIVTAKSSKKEDSRSTVGVHTEAKEDYHSSSSFGRDAETVEEEEEVAPLVFPSLNNPAPDSSYFGIFLFCRTHFHTFVITLQDPLRGHPRPLELLLPRI
ncbi:hypothetical protein DFP72DRAFT_1070016 [Ephemerocybe angulata]|uniref:Uncharacterized protein n=1 Tax=Ephemerocybe angulata TaxID=980116 RepID=A0A8H6HTB8_9AGAR|nr:hypothetical protein DFP72DRAFT_1070016 [Tulosesus angulatus]